MIPEAFGARLRHERERRGIAIASIADRTKIAPHLLVALERGDLTRWPGGFYRRAFIRAYAESIGLDPNEVLQELRECCPDPTETAPEAGDAYATDTPPASPTAAPAAPASAMVRLRIDPAPRVCRGGPILSDARHRIAAIAADLAILGVIAVGSAAALDEFWMPLAVAMAGYYAGGILIFGNTPGVCLSAAVAAEEHSRREASHPSHG